MRAALREFAVYCFYAALAIAFTWPLLPDIATAVANRGDPLLNAWIIDWVCHALRTQPLRLFDAPIFHPAKFPLAFSEHLTGLALLVMPFGIAGAPPIALHNIALLFSFSLSGYGAFVLARLIVCRTIPAMAAGVFYAFVPFRFDHLSHVQVVVGGWLPLSLAALITFWRTGRRAHAASFFAAFVMNSLSNIYWMLFGGFALAMTIAFLSVVEPRSDIPFQRRLILAITGAFLVILPFLIPYAIVSEQYRMKRNSMESLGGSATPRDWLEPSATSLLYGRFAAGSREERRLFPGVLVLLVAIGGFIAERWSAGASPARADERAGAPLRRRLIVAAIFFAAIGSIVAFAGRVTIGSFTFAGSDVPFMVAVVCLIASLPLRDMVLRSRYSPELWIAGLWIGIGFIGSLGENAFLHSFLFRVIEPFRATRVPARWATIAYVGLAVWMAWGALPLERRWGRLVAPIVLVLSIVEMVPRLKWVHVGGFKPVYYWLAKARPRAAIELPIGWDENELGYVFATTLHRVPILNGVSGFDPPLHERLSKHEYDAKMLELINQSGATVVIVHPQARERARRWIESGDLTPLATFRDGDTAYAISASSRR